MYAFPPKINIYYFVDDYVQYIYIWETISAWCIFLSSTRRLISCACCFILAYDFGTNINTLEYALGRGEGVIKKSTLCTLS